MSPSPASRGRESEMGRESEWPRSKLDEARDVVAGRTMKLATGEHLAAVLAEFEALTADRDRLMRELVVAAEEADRFRKGLETVVRINDECRCTTDWCTCSTVMVAVAESALAGGEGKP